MGDVPRIALRRALILFTAVPTAAVLGCAIWSRLATELSVRTDIVGYPPFATSTSSAATSATGLSPPSFRW
jgi:hypothetical protein